MATEFFLPMRKVPTVTHQQKQVTIQNGKPVFYEPDVVKSARSKLLAHLGKHAPAKPYTGPIRLVVKWCYPIAGEHTDGEWKTTKPDVDNAQKLLQDCMTELGFWKDDAQIASLIAEKFWARIPGIYIRIEEL